MISKAHNDIVVQKLRERQLNACESAIFPFLSSAFFSFFFFFWKGGGGGVVSFPDRIFRARSVKSSLGTRLGGGGGGGYILSS